MDPNAALAEIRALSSPFDAEARRWAVESIAEWLQRGGCEPSWTSAERRDFWAEYERYTAQLPD